MHSSAFSLQVFSLSQIFICSSSLIFSHSLSAPPTFTQKSQSETPLELHIEAPIWKETKPPSLPLFSLIDYFLAPPIEDFNINKPEAKWSKIVKKFTLSISCFSLTYCWVSHSAIGIPQPCKTSIFRYHIASNSISMLCLLASYFLPWK